MTPDPRSIQDMIKNINFEQPKKITCNWKHIGNVDSLTIAEQRIEKYNKEYSEYEYKTGKPKGQYSYSWQVGLYRRKILSAKGLQIVPERG